MEQLDGSGGNLKVETVRSLHECELEEKDLSEVLNQKNVTLEQITDKQELQVLKAIKQSTLPEAPDPPLPCFLRAHINQPLTTAATLSAAATAPLFPSIPPRTCLFVRGLFRSNLIILNLDIINGSHLILVCSRNSKRHVR